jgi:predicted TIM-barrel enzyme
MYTNSGNHQSSIMYLYAYKQLNQIEDTVADLFLPPRQQTTKLAIDPFASCGVALLAILFRSCPGVSNVYIQCSQDIDYQMMISTIVYQLLQDEYSYLFLF